MDFYQRLQFICFTLMNQSSVFLSEQKRLKAAEAESKLKQVYIPT